MRSRVLTAGMLRTMLAELPDDAPVVTSAPDHALRFATAAVTTGLYHKPSASWSEDYGEELSPEGEEFGKRFKVLRVD